MRSSLPKVFFLIISGLILSVFVNVPVVFGQCPSGYAEELFSGRCILPHNVSRNSKLKYSVCPIGYREDQKTKECIPPSSAKANVVFQKSNSQDAKKFPASTKVRSRPQAYWVGEDGQWFLKIDHGSDCSDLFVLKGIDENKEPRHKQPWFKRMMARLETPEIWLSERDTFGDDLVEAIAQGGGFFAVWALEQKRNKLNRLPVDWVRLYETDGWYRLQIGSKEAKVMMQQLGAKKGAVGLQLFGSPIWAGAHFDALSSDRMGFELNKRASKPKITPPLICEMVRPSDWNTYRGIELEKLCKGHRRRAKETEITLNDTAQGNQPKSCFPQIVLNHSSRNLASRGLRGSL